ncbi:hypothetical protein V1477_019137 [Vespula maculifrons]|uniref:Uncharacterized protein n=1 Tax=Vespula maculifrons TaxID=7453 RepID=A0ABD2ARR3_VESMC
MTVEISIDFRFDSGFLSNRKFGEPSTGKGRLWNTRDSRGPRFESFETLNAPANRLQSPTNRFRTLPFRPDTLSDFVFNGNALSDGISNES